MTVLTEVLNHTYGFKIERLKLILYCCYSVARGRRANGISYKWNFRSTRIAVRWNISVRQAVPPGCIPLHWSKAPFPALKRNPGCIRTERRLDRPGCIPRVCSEAGSYGTDLSSQHQYHLSRQHLRRRDSHCDPGIRRERGESDAPTSPRCTTRGRNPFRSATSIMWANSDWIAAIATLRWRFPPRRACRRRKPA